MEFAFEDIHFKVSLTKLLQDLAYVRHVLLPRLTMDLGNRPSRPGKSRWGNRRGYHSCSAGTWPAHHWSGQRGAHDICRLPRTSQTRSILLTEPKTAYEGEQKTHRYKNKRTQANS